MTKIFPVIFMSNLDNKTVTNPKSDKTGVEEHKQTVNTKELTEEQLTRLISELREDKDQNEIVETKPFAERVLQKKGVFNNLYKKVPLRYIGISSFSQTHQTIADSIESLKSPICPKCCGAILMYNKRLKYRDGTVDWFCADDQCGYKLRYSPVRSEISERVRELSYSLNANRWDRLTEKEKVELISSHLSKAVIYRNIAALFFMVFVLELLFSMWMVALVTGALIFAIFVRALAWCYRAYQIKTGKVFDKRIPFSDWLTSADKWFSVDWVDELEDTGDSSE